MTTSVRRLSGDDRPLVEELVDLINGVYATAERGLWREGMARTTADELASLIRSREIVVAIREDRIVGSVCVRDVSGEHSEFGMLAAVPDERGTGVGNALLDFIERASRGRGMRAMQLELLVPRGWSHPGKEFLRSWYGRRGYRLVRAGPLGDAYPHLAPRLAMPCDLEVHQKPLS
jgi:GNAT superfamily N-acetyltransferase